MTVPTQEETKAALVRRNDHAVSLPVFEGPLDLLLFLIRKNEIDIYDIPILSITRQYTDLLKKLEMRDIELAGDYFVMAATLMQIKSRMLLPKEERWVDEDSDPDEAVDPRWELVQQLIEYRKFKQAAGQVAQLMEEAQNTLFRDFDPGDEAQPARPLKPTDAVSLWNTFNTVLRRLSEKIVVGQIHAETVTVSERMESIIELLGKRPRFRFSELFRSGDSIPFIIATFLALLELNRLNQLNLEQSSAFTDIECTARGNKPA